MPENSSFGVKSVHLDGFPKSELVDMRYKDSPKTRRGFEVGWRRGKRSVSFWTSKGRAVGQIGEGGLTE